MENGHFRNIAEARKLLDTAVNWANSLPIWVEDLERTL